MSTPKRLQISSTRMIMILSSPILLPLKYLGGAVRFTSIGFQSSSYLGCFRFCRVIRYQHLFWVPLSLRIYTIPIHQNAQFFFFVFLQFSTMEQVF